MYLQQFQLDNITCFETLHLDFRQEESEHLCQWIVLPGENGTGKTTILHMLALALLGEQLIHPIAAGINWKKYIRSGATDGRIATIVQATPDDRRPSSPLTTHQANFKLSNLKSGLQREILTPQNGVSVLDETLYADTITNGWFACGYGPWRRLLPYYSNQTALAQNRSKPYRFATLFDERLSLTLVNNWLIDLEFRCLKEPENQDIKKTRRLALRSLEQALGDMQVKEITPEGILLEETGSTTVLLDNLSDGYRSIAAWVLDLVRRLVDAFPHLDNPLAASGIVLVDEIDIHLHPQWQRTIVEQIRDIFPNLQFIISTHSPFVVQDMRPQDKIVVLKKQQSGVVAETASGFARSWRVDQILTSSLFGLETTRDDGIAIAEKEYQQLLDQKAAGTLTDENKQQLEQLKQWLAEKKSPHCVKRDGHTTSSWKALPRELLPRDLNTLVRKDQDMPIGK